MRDILLLFGSAAQAGQTTIQIRKRRRRRKRKRRRRMSAEPLEQLKKPVAEESIHFDIALECCCDQQETDTKERTGPR
jgi:hypothetical protein